MRHECHARRKANDEAKEFYRRERCAQLKRYSAKKLCRVLASGEARNSQLNKRKFGHSDGFPAIDASKVRKRNPTQVSDAMFMTTENLYGKSSTCSPYRVIDVAHRISALPARRKSGAAAVIFFLAFDWNEPVDNFVKYFLPAEDASTWPV